MESRAGAQIAVARARPAGRSLRLALAAALALAPPASARAALAPSLAAAAQPGLAGAPLPSDEALERDGAVIGEILIRVEDVFDTTLPAESRAFHTLANRMHIDTRPEVIRRQLLFASGERYSAALLRETERLLRGRDYLIDCSIRPLRYRDNVVDLEVWVKDVWTLKPGVSFGRGGGVNDWRVQLEDRNLLGTGRQVALDYETTVDRSSLAAEFQDGNLLGSRWALEALYSRGSDGNNVGLELVRPFYSLDARWASGVRLIGHDRVDTLYTLGEPVDRYFRQQEQLEVFGGRSRGLRDGTVRRWSAGVTYQRDRFADAPGQEPSSRLPEDRTTVYPWIGFESVANVYATARNQDWLGRTEDVALGGHYRLRLGLASTALGSDRDQLVFRASAEHGYKPSPPLTLQTVAAALGRWDGGGGFENLLAIAEGRLYRRNLGGHLFYANLQLAAAEDLDGRKPPEVHRVGGARQPHLQLLLGGDSGLRGYPLRYQDGDYRALLTLEQRFFTGFYPFRLAYVGAAVFFDVGRTWPGEDSGPNLGWLSDVGVGLRLSSSRSGFGTVVHIDVAFPLDRQESIDAVQFLVTSRKTL